MRKNKESRENNNEESYDDNAEKSATLIYGGYDSAWALIN
jgi:hypothetical protein